MNGRWTPDEHVHPGDARHAEELHLEGDGSQVGLGLSLLALSAVSVAGVCIALML